MDSERKAVIAGQLDTAEVRLRHLTELLGSGRVVIPFAEIAQEPVPQELMFDSAFNFLTMSPRERRSHLSKMRERQAIEEAERKIQREVAGAKFIDAAQEKRERRKAKRVALLQKGTK